MTTTTTNNNDNNNSSNDSNNHNDNIMEAGARSTERLTAIVHTHTSYRILTITSPTITPEPTFMLFNIYIIGGVKFNVCVLAINVC